VRVLIADDHHLVRAGIRRLLESSADFDVVAEASNGREALELVALHLPDVALMDLSMPEVSGLEAAREIRRRFERVEVVILSMHADAANVREALAHGVRGFVVKDAAPIELELALRAAMRGETFLSPQVSARVVDSMLGRSAQGFAALSPRQREVFVKMGAGRSSKEIAAEMQLSSKTVETHRARIMETLGCRHGSELVRMAIRHAGGLE
jgi:DNA-binding NarL/FixJ family response regulator